MRLWCVSRSVLGRFPSTPVTYVFGLNEAHVRRTYGLGDAYAVQRAEPGSVTPCGRYVPDDQNSRRQQTSRRHCESAVRPKLAAR